MVNLPRPSGKEMVQFLERQGFVLVRIRGSHHFLENELIGRVSPCTAITR